MSPLSLGSAAASSALSVAPPAPAGDRAKLAEAARQFEAIFVRQMLASARQASLGDELFGGQAMATFREMQDNRFAELTAQTGALGLAKQIEAHLAHQLDAAGGAKP